MTKSYVQDDRHLEDPMVKKFRVKMLVETLLLEIYTSTIFENYEVSPMYLCSPSKVTSLKSPLEYDLLHDKYFIV